MKILILGGTNLTGPFATRHLVEQGHQVTIFHRGKHQVDLPPTVNRIIGERRKLDEFRGHGFSRVAKCRTHEFYAFVNLRYIYKRPSRLKESAK